MHTQTPYTYVTRAEAVIVVNELNSGIYHLGHGEYSRPHYTVRKVRGEDSYYIHARRYFYAGTLNAPTSGALTA
jgi:hypothetical protein